MRTKTTCPAVRVTSARDVPTEPLGSASQNPAGASSLQASCAPEPGQPVRTLMMVSKFVTGLQVSKRI